MLTMRRLRPRQLPRIHLPPGIVGNDCQAVLLGDDVVYRQRLRRGSGNCCNILGIGFILGIRIATYASNGIRVIAGVRLGLEIYGFDFAARSCRSAVAQSRMTGNRSTKLLLSATVSDKLDGIVAGRWEHTILFMSSTTACAEHASVSYRSCVGFHVGVGSFFSRRVLTRISSCAAGRLGSWP